MVSMNKFHREVVDWLEDEYGVSGARLEEGGKHPRLKFEFQGRSYSSVVPSTPSDWRTTRNMQTQLKQQLGPPPQLEERTPRKLDDMLKEVTMDNTLGTLEERARILPTSPTSPASPAEELEKEEKTTWEVKVASYKNNNASSKTVWFLLPIEAEPLIKKRYGYRTEKLDEENWKLVPDSKGRSFFKYGENWLKITYTDREMPLFGASWGTATRDATGEIRVHLPVSARLEVKSEIPWTPPTPAQKPAQNPSAPHPAPPWASSIPSPAPSSPAPSALPEDRMRQIIKDVRELEAQLPYRLVRLESGKLVWRAPTIEYVEAGEQ